MQFIINSLRLFEVIDNHYRLSIFSVRLFVLKIMLLCLSYLVFLVRTEELHLLVLCIYIFSLLFYWYYCVKIEGKIKTKYVGPRDLVKNIIFLNFLFIPLVIGVVGFIFLDFDFLVFCLSFFIYWMLYYLLLFVQKIFFKKFHVFLLLISKGRLKAKVFVVDERNLLEID